MARRVENDPNYALEYGFENEPKQEAETAAYLASLTVADLEVVIARIEDQIVLLAYAPFCVNAASKRAEYERQFAPYAAELASREPIALAA